MKQILTFSAVLFTLLFLLFSDTDRRIQIFTELAGPGMLSLLKQSSIPADSEVLESPRIALTFDDGPNARYTPLLLDGLRKRNIHATFFLLGENIPENEKLLLRMQEDGHLIGCHTWSHVQLDKISPSNASREILKTNSLIYHITGTYPTCLRPPYGAWKKDLELPVTMLPIFWDVDTLDWQSQNPESILDIVRRNVQDGSIILMHDSYDSSVKAALAITDELTEKGYDFVTADQLLDP